MLDRHLEEVACVVHLVHQPQVFPALVGVLDDEVRDQEPVLLLSGQDVIENAFHALAQLVVFAMLQGVHRAFQGLVEIRVERPVSGGGTLHHARRLVEVGDVPILLQAVQRVGDGYLVVGLETRAPEPAAQFHLLVIHLVQPMRRRQVGPCSGAHEAEGKKEHRQRPAQDPKPLGARRYEAPPWPSKAMSPAHGTEAESDPRDTRGDEPGLMKGAHRKSSF